MLHGMKGWPFVFAVAGIFLAWLFYFLQGSQGFRKNILTFDKPTAHIVEPPQSSDRLRKFFYFVVIGGPLPTAPDIFDLQADRLLRSNGVFAV